jgi:hypothetical protein
MAASWDGDITAGLENDSFIGTRDIGVEGIKDMSMSDINFALLGRHLMLRDTTTPLHPSHPSHFTDYALAPSWPFFNLFALRWHQRGGILMIMRKWFSRTTSHSVGVWCTDSVGLGKTAQTIGAICLVRHYFHYFRSKEDVVMPPGIV